MGVNNLENRKIFLDVAKGILIILVVMGHSQDLQPFLRTVIYWFHMPAFFMISGYLYSSPLDKGLTFKNWLIKTSKRYLIPYFAYYFLISIFISRNFSPHDFLNFLYGGRMYQGVFWYIPCLFLTIMIFSYINRKLSKIQSILIIFVLYVLGHIESLFYLPNNENYLSWHIIYKIPLNLDVCLVSLAYFSLGYYLKEKIEKFTTSKKLFLTTTVLCISLIALGFFGVFHLSIDMKLANYKNPLLDILIPTLFYIWILQFSNLLSLFDFISKPMSYLGKNTLSVMYLHLPINGLLQRHGTISFVLLGVLIPLIFSYICNKNQMLSFFFLGNKNWNVKAVFKGKNVD